jgi:hypothetical protein
MLSKDMILASFSLIWQEKKFQLLASLYLYTLNQLRAAALKILLNGHFDAQPNCLL